MISIAEQRTHMGLAAKDVPKVMPSTCVTPMPGIEPVHHYQASTMPGALWTCTWGGHTLVMR